MGPWICIGAKGPSAPSNLNSLLWDFGLVVGPWTCSGALDLHWGEGAFGPFQFKQPPLGLWTCSGALDLYWGKGIERISSLSIERTEQDSVYSLHKSFQTRYFPFSLYTKRIKGISVLPIKRLERDSKQGGALFRFRENKK